MVKSRSLPVKLSSLSLPTKYRDLLLICALIGLLLVTRLYLLASMRTVGIGSDELQAVIYGANTTFSRFLHNMNLEPHPPTYYAQLYYWMKLGKDGLWLRFNPLFWSIATALMIWLAGKTIFTKKVGLVAVLIYILLPYPLPVSIEVSKYAVMFFLTPALAASVLWFFKGSRVWLAGIAVILGSLAYLYSHGAGALILIPTNTYALLLAFSKHPWKTRRLILFGLGQIPILIAYIPWVLRASPISLAHPFKDFSGAITQILFGYYMILPPLPGWLKTLGVTLFIVLSILILFHKEARSLYLSFVLAPIAACALISVWLRPIWLPRVIAPFLPLFALSLAAMIVPPPATSQNQRLEKLRRSVEWGALTVLLVGILAGLWTEYTRYAPWTPVKQPAQLILEQGEQGDVVAIPDIRMYWSTMWYILGKDSFALEDLYNETMLPNRIRVISSADRLNPITGHNYWWIYRDGEDHSIFDRNDPLLTFKVVGQFENTTVERVTVRP